MKVSELKSEIMEVYSDGACSPNPGLGGYGYVVRFRNPDPGDDLCDEIIITGSEGIKDTTNNRMELQGCLEGLIKSMEIMHGLRTINFATATEYRDWKSNHPDVRIIAEAMDPYPGMYLQVVTSLPFTKVHVLSDSSYLCRGFEKGWVKKWKTSGWKTAAGEPVKNIDVWQSIDMQLERMKREYGMGHHFICVPGHRGHKFNEVCDQLAVAARKAIRNH